MQQRLWLTVIEDGTAVSNRPDIARVAALHAPKGLSGADGLRGPGAAVPLQDGVKEFFRAVDGGLIKATYT